MTRSLIADIAVPVFLLLCGPAVFQERAAAQQDRVPKTAVPPAQAVSPGP